MEKRFKIFLLFIGLIVLVNGCSKTEKNNNSSTLKVFVSILPQKYFVEEIGGKRVDVNVLVKPGKSPATYEPLPDQVISLSDAKILFTIGVPFENAFLSKIKSTLKQITIIDTSKGIKKRKLEHHKHDDEEHHDDHDKHDKHDKHDDHDDHDDHHGEMIDDPHIWLSPTLVKVQAKTIYNSLVKQDPKGEDVYKKGYKNLISELDSINIELKKVFAPYKGKTIFVFHPAFGYLTDSYGLKQVAIETGGKSPSPFALEKIIQHAKSKNVKIIFVQPEFSKKSAQAIATAIDGKVVTINPLNPDYIKNLRMMAQQIKKGLK